jgi:DNA-directed RNA polymerase subunit K/omega
MADELEQPTTEPTGDERPVVTAPLITDRFLFVDVAALRAKQLRRGALPRLQSETETHSELPAKAERIAMEEVRRGLVQYDTPASRKAAGIIDPPV